MFYMMARLCPKYVIREDKCYLSKRIEQKGKFPENLIYCLTQGKFMKKIIPSDKVSTTSMDGESTVKRLSKL